MSCRPEKRFSIITKEYPSYPYGYGKLNNTGLIILIMRMMLDKFTIDSKKNFRIIDFAMYPEA